MKRLRADDSAGSRVKVGHRQAPIASKPPRNLTYRSRGGSVFGGGLYVGQLIFLHETWANIRMQLAIPS